MPSVNILSIQRVRAAERARIEAIDPGVRLTDAGGWFDGEYRETWPAYSVARYLAPNSIGRGTREERDRLRAALGMRVVGTRRQPPAPDAPLPPGFSRLGGAADLDGMLPESDFVVICCQWTPETTHLFNKDCFAAMKEGAILVNVARGEI